MKNTLHKFLLLMYFSLPVSAHDFWLSSDNFNPNINDSVGISVKVGQGFIGESLPRIDEWFVRFEQFKNGQISLINGNVGDDPIGRVAITDEQLMVIYQSTFDYVDLPFEKFNKYLKKEHFDETIAQRKLNNNQQKSGKEYYARYTKLLLNSIDQKPNPAIYQKTALELDLVPKNPIWSVGHNKFALYFQQKPLPNVIISAYSKEHPDVVIQAATDKQGEVELNLPFSQTWNVRAVYMLPARKLRKEKADWESLWASLVFRK